jgi:hypothetical protein
MDGWGPRPGEGRGFFLRREGGASSLLRPRPRLGHCPQCNEGLGSFGDRCLTRPSAFVSNPRFLSARAADQRVACPWRGPARSDQEEMCSLFTGCNGAPPVHGQNQRRDLPDRSIDTFASLPDATHRGAEGDIEEWLCSSRPNRLP